MNYYSFEGLQHLYIHWPFCLYKCHFCDKRFRNLLGWALHEVSRSCKELECPLCSKKCSIHGLEKHVLTHTDDIEILMYAIKTIETNGRYKEKSQWSDACGAYQYMPITWDNYKGFKNACLAPEWVQDSKMRGEINWAWNKYHNWDKVIAAHYMPSYANQENLWNIHIFKGQPTIRQYVQNVEQTMNSVEAGLATA